MEQDFGFGLQPIAFASQKLNATEMQYSAYGKEMLGIVWALGRWKHYFQSPLLIIIQTDHAPLRHLPNQTFVNSRVWRWISILQGYNVEIRHIPLHGLVFFDLRPDQSSSPMSSELPIVPQIFPSFHLSPALVSITPSNDLCGHYSFTVCKAVFIADLLAT